jgi:hypothetical protein
MRENSSETCRIRRPIADDFSEPPLVGALREGGEAASGAAKASMRIVRPLLALFLLPIVTLPAVMRVEFGLAQWAKLLWVYAAMFGLAAIAWSWGFRGEWRGRLRRRSARLNMLEDTSRLRRRLLRNPQGETHLD